jgi:glycosyltransferase involved in cell wall biosynthesis
MEGLGGTQVKRVLKSLFRAFRKTSIGRWVLRSTPSNLKNAIKALLVVQALPPNQNHLDPWVDKHFSDHLLEDIEEHESEPLFSILIPVYKVDNSVFKLLLDSLVSQTFKNFEVCIAAHDTSQEILNAIKKYESILSIKLSVSSENLGISHTSNTGLKLTSGEYVVLLDHDDELPSHALNSIACSIQSNPETVLFYTDKRTVDSDARTIDVFMKPSWSPELMLSANYITHLNAIKKSALVGVGGWDPNTDGAQDWDLFLRLANLGKPITHVPTVGYTWRQVATSVALNGVIAKPYITKSQELALQKHLDGNFPGSSVKISKNGMPKYFWKTPKTITALGEIELEKLIAGVRSGEGNYEDETVVILGSQTRYKIAEGDFSDISGMLINKEISGVSGVFVDESGLVIDGARVRLDTGEFRQIFWRLPLESQRVNGRVDWIRNVSSLPRLIFAARYGDLKKLARDKISFEELISSLGDIGRLVVNPALVIEINDGSEATPVAGKIADSYFTAETKIDINGPILDDTPAPSHGLSDPYQSQAEYFLNSLPHPRKFVQNHKSPIRRIAWILPELSSAGYGGIRTILRFADYLAERNISSDFKINGPKVSPVIINEIIRDFPALSKAKFSYFVTGEILKLDEYDLGVATLWTTAFHLAAASGNLKRAYLVQDFEPDFYPSGTMKLLAFHSYELGLTHIANTRALADVLKNNGINSTSFSPGVDKDIFNDMGRSDDATKPVRLFFYMRPNHLRNCFELNIEIIKRLKPRFGSAIEINCAGAYFNPKDFGIDGYINYIGMLPYEETGNLYKSIDIGVSLMASSHPSYPPIEMMACGVTVVTNTNPATAKFFNPDNSAIVSPVVDEVVQKITFLIENPIERKALGEKAARFATVNIPDWDKVSQEFVEILESM